ncbi:MAG TPA: hypothetical protein VEI02_00865, partial [Planctomycetota bacterium]|nr:hypothetical protein [Planctomycetota bacterium]
PLLDQFNLPLGVEPFHYIAPDTSVTFGPYYLPPGLTFEGVTFDFTGGALQCVSTVQRITVQ